MITVLKSKLSYVTVTKSDLYYDGSLGIDETILNQANIIEFEQIHVLNVTNGERFITYAIKELAGSKKINVYGAAAKKTSIGDELIILSYSIVDSKKSSIQPIVLNFKT